MAEGNVLNLKIKIEPAKKALLDELEALQGVANKKPVKLKLDIDTTSARGEIASLQNSLAKSVGGGSSGSATDKVNKGTQKSIKSLETFTKKINDSYHTIATKRNNLNKLIASDSQNLIPTNSLAMYKKQLAEAEQYVSRLDTIKKQLHNKSIGKDADFSQYKGLLDESSAKSSQLNSAIGDVKRFTGAYEDAGKKLKAFDRLGDRLNSYYKQHETAINKNIDVYNRYRSVLNKVNNGQYATIADANRDFASFRTEARKSGVEIEGFGAKLERTFGARVRSAMAGQGVFLMQSALRGILQNAVEVDTAMTELKKVTDETNAVYTQFLTGAASRAQVLGATLSEVVNATADFARLGYDIPEATELSNAALIYSNVGDDVANIDDATSSLISTMQGFGIASSDAMGIIDKFNNVSNNYASSAGDIGQIIKRSAASMNAAGNSLDQSIALGVTANEVQQDADTVGKICA